MKTLGQNSVEINTVPSLGQTSPKLTFDTTLYLASNSRQAEATID
jgi:hypothetical protein